MILRPRHMLNRIGQKMRGGGLRLEQAEAKGPLVFYYDLDVCPVTWDFLVCLVMADQYRRRMEIDTFHVCIVNGRHHGFRHESADYSRAVSLADRAWRVQALLLPILQLFPRCTGHTLCSSRDQVKMFAGLPSFPVGYSPTFPLVPNQYLLHVMAKEGHRPDVLRTSVQAKRYVDQWLRFRLGDRPLITITLRDYGFMLERNSNRWAWYRFAERIGAQYKVVIVPDTSRALDPQPDTVETFPLASLDPLIRAALYEKAAMNFGVASGPMSLAVFSHSPYRIFKMGGSKMHVEDRGWVRGQSPGWASPVRQRWLWEDDSIENIEREFTSLTSGQ